MTLSQLQQPFGIFLSLVGGSIDIVQEVEDMPVGTEVELLAVAPQWRPGEAGTFSEQLEGFDGNHPQ